MRRGLHHGISLETSVSDFSGRRQARSVVGDRRRRRNLHFGIVQRQALRHAAQGPQERRQIDQARNFRRTDSCSRGTRPSWCDHGCGAGKTEPRVYYSGAWRYRHGSQRILLRRWHRDRCLRPQGWHPNPHPANARQAQPASTRFPHQQRQCLPQPPQGMAASLPWRRDEEPAQLPWLAPYSGGLGPKDHARGFYLWSDRIRPISTINAIRAILYDNTKLAVARIAGDGTRQRTRVFSELQSHYLFADRFGRPGKGNDKGKVEGLVGLIRRNYLVPIPHAVSFAALNAELLADCRRRLGDRLRGHDETIGERLARDLACFHDLPGSPYDACDKQAARVSSLSLVRYRGNDYSVPTAYGHREVLVRGYVHEVVIACAGGEIARHARSYAHEDFVFNPLHYLALLERKIGALDQAAPLVGWQLPEEFATLRRLLEARLGKLGKREFVQVLRLMEVFEIEDVAAGVRDAIDRGVIGFDAVKHLVLCRIERRPARLDMTVYPYLPRASVATTSAETYMSLLSGMAS